MLNKYCLDCGKKVKRLGTLRCKECYFKQPSKIKGVKKSPEHIAKISGENSSSWKGGKHIDFWGYIKVRCKDHPNAKNGYVSEHRLVMEKFIGRYLYKNEEIHHIDGNKQNNDIKNLKLFINHSKHLVYEHKHRKRRAKLKS